MDIKNITATILAVLATVGVLIIMGYVPYKFIGYMLLGMILYFYVTLSQIDDVLIRSLGLMAIVGLIVGWWTGLFDVLKTLFDPSVVNEGFFVAPVKKISDALTAKECQDSCESAQICKYSQVPLGTTQSGAKNACWNSYGIYQNAWGSRNQGGDTWQNKLYKEPITASETRGYDRWTPIVAYKTNPGKKDRLSISDMNVKMIPGQLNMTVSLRDQGWGNRTWGIYIVGLNDKGQEVFKEVMQAPRTGYKLRYPVYQDYYYNRRVPYWTRVRTGGHCHGGWWWYRRRCHYGYRNVLRYRNVRTKGRRVIKYGTKNVQGGLSTRSLSKVYNGPGGKNIGAISKIKVYAETRGQGHSLEAGRVTWSVRGWPLAGQRSIARDFSRTTRIQLLSGWTTLWNRKGQILRRNFKTNGNYRLSFTIHPRYDARSRGNLPAGWSNIMHFTTTGRNCCSYGDRTPAIWFFPRSTRLHIRCGTKSSGNFGHDPPHLLRAHSNTTVVVTCKGNRMTVQLSGSYTYNWSGAIDSRRPGSDGWVTGTFYVTDPWYAPSQAWIRNLVWENL